MEKQDLALNNLQRLMCHKNKPNQTKLFLIVDVLAIPSTFLQLSVINFIFTFRTANVFGCFRGVMSPLEIIKQKLPN